MNRKRIRKYFTCKPHAGPAITRLVLAVATFGGGIYFFNQGMIPLDAFHWCLGAGALFVFLAILATRKYWGRASDAEVDAAIRDEIVAKQRERSLKKLGLEWEEVSEVTPIEIWCPCFGPSRLAHARNPAQKRAIPPYRDIRGNDGRWRSPEIEMNAFYFSEDMVHFCRWIASLVGDEERLGTEEIYYKDIVSVKMETQDVRLPGGSVIQQEKFMIRNSAGEFLSCAASNAEVEAAVTAMRALIKAKKTA